MICRKLYKTENQDNYNIVFFQSKGVKFPETLYISVLNAENKGYTRKITSISVEEYFTNEEHTISLLDNDEIIMTAVFYKDSDDIFNSSISQIRFKGSRSRIGSMYNITFYVGYTAEEVIEKKASSMDDVKFVFAKVEQLIFTNTNVDEYWYNDSKDNIIPFKDFCLAKKIDGNYAEKQEGVAYSLIQRLSIIRGELWYQINHGLPLLDKVRSGEVFDSVIIQIILRHPDVKNINDFQSSISNNHNYKFYAKVMTIYNVEIELSNTY